MSRYGASLGATSTAILGCYRCRNSSTRWCPALSGGGSASRKSSQRWRACKGRVRVARQARTRIASSGANTGEWRHRGLGTSGGRHPSAMPIGRGRVHRYFSERRGGPTF